MTVEQVEGKQGPGVFAQRIRPVVRALIEGGILRRLSRPDPPTSEEGKEREKRRFLTEAERMHEETMRPSG